MSVELGLAIVGLVDLCYKYGKDLLKTCQAFQAADSRLSESVVRVEACWVRIEVQLQVVRSLATLVDERHLYIQQRTLEVLQTKLLAADKRLAGLVRGVTSNERATNVLAVEARRWKYALARDSLAEAIADVEAWQQIFDPTWFLIMRMASPQIDNQLRIASLAPQTVTHQEASQPIDAARKLRRALNSESRNSESIIFSREGLMPEGDRPVLLSSTSTARRVANGQLVLLDPIASTLRQYSNTVLKDARNFAKKLRHADPFTFGLLECKGILKEGNECSNEASAVARMSFIFRLPATHQATQSLRHRLLTGPEYGSLSEQLALARQLVKAVSYVHIYGFVHKNIRPETILIISRNSERRDTTTLEEEPGEGEDNAETAVLVGFDVLRDADGNTRRFGDDDWEKNLYRHPQRQGRTLEVDYEMRHDIYSVGVCLLEIGLWETFVKYDKDGVEEHALGAPVASPSLELQNNLSFGNHSGVDIPRDPNGVKGALLYLARRNLRRKMGTKYSKVVETCLTCIDEGNSDFGDEREFQDEDGVAVGVRYIEKVVSKLAEIAI